MFSKKKKEEEIVPIDPSEATEIFVPKEDEPKPESRAMFLAKEALFDAKKVVEFWEGEIVKIEQAEAKN